MYTKATSGNINMGAISSLRCRRKVKIEKLKTVEKRIGDGVADFSSCRGHAENKSVYCTTYGEMKMKLRKMHTVF